MALGAIVLLTGCSGRTTGATNITEDSALLNATGSCDFGNCTAKMRWRVVGTTNWTNGPLITNIPVASNAPISSSATGLTPGTQYEYQACGREVGFPAGLFVCAGPDGLQDTTDPFSTLPPPIPDPKLRRYPYLTDVVGTSATVNWATDRSPRPEC